VGQTPGTVTEVVLETITTLGSSLVGRMGAPMMAVLVLVVAKEVVVKVVAMEVVVEVRVRGGGRG